jgi:hypothetical protein
VPKVWREFGKHRALTAVKGEIPALPITAAGFICAAHHRHSLSFRNKTPAGVGRVPRLHCQNAAKTVYRGERGEALLDHSAKGKPSSLGAGPASLSILWVFSDRQERLHRPPVRRRQDSVVGPALFR